MHGLAPFPDAPHGRLRTVRTAGVPERSAGGDARGVDDVAGYRVLRSAGRGDRTRLLVGFAEGETVVLKVGSTTDPEVHVEIAALDRAAGDHVVRLLDVAADEFETTLVLERMSHGTLADLLDRRAGLDAGEAVTILAPLAVTLDRMHGAGVAHGALSLTSVAFRSDGAPTLVGFGRAELFAAGTPEVVRETIPGVVADRAALGGLAEVVLARVGGRGSDAARRLASALAGVPPAAVATQLFGLAAPEPVGFRADAESPNLEWAAPAVEAEPVAAAGETRDPLPPWLVALLPDGLRSRLDALTRLLLEHRGAWDPRRRRLVLGAVAGGATLVLAVAAIPASPASTVEPPATPTPSTEPAAPPDDPVDAAVHLLAERERCLRDLSILCLDGVAQPGSAAAAEDAAEIRAIQAGADLSPRLLEPGRPILVERLGDAALLDLPAGSEPASLQLLLTDEGWRIRSYLDAPPSR